MLMLKRLMMLTMIVRRTVVDYSLLIVVLIPSCIHCRGSVEALLLVCFGVALGLPTLDLGIP